MMEALNLAGSTLLASALLVSVSTEAWASPSVSLEETQIRRTVALREAGRNPLWISKADCLADDIMTFQLYLADYVGVQLEVWAGATDCTELAARADKTATCWRLSDVLQPATNSLKVDVRVQDIVAHHLPPQTGGGISADCENSATDTPVAVSLYFMWVDPGTRQSAGGYKWNTWYDLEGPDAPAELVAEVTGGRSEADVGAIAEHT